MSSSSRSELARLLRTHSVRRGQFELSSGQTSDVYVDVKATSLTGGGADLIGRLLWELIEDLSPRPRAIGGLTLGADPLVTAVALTAHRLGAELEAVIVRKESKGHGTGRAIEAPPILEQGARIVAVDDVITTGGSTLAAIESMREAGFVVDQAICVVDREASGRQALADAGVTLHALFTLAELLES